MDNMPFFQWTQAFQTGSAVVDEQHEQLVNIINQFGGLLTRKAPTPEDMESVCSQLIDYTHYHFEEEERLMTSAGLDARHLSQHHQQHQALISEIAPMRQLATHGDLAAGKYLLEFLINWLVFHILGTDMLMARQIRAIDRGQSAEEAYWAEEIDGQNATGPLLAAVKKLLYQVSSRNRQLVEMNETLEQKVQKRTLELSESNRRLQELASTDSLTGLLNRRAFMDAFKNKFDLARRHQRPLSLLMIDVDHFKRINDTHGHQMGDWVLVQLSAIMTKSLRGTDVLGRIGGEEFALLLPETAHSQAVELSERLLETIRRTTLQASPQTTLTITASIGLTTVPPFSSEIDSVMKQADEALYRAKTTGRDRCCGSDPKRGSLF